MEYIVTGIGTEVGKTVVSALLCETLGADYWKPIQSGLDEGSDSRTIAELAGPEVTVHPEAYCLRAPLSPHAAAALEDTEIQPASLRIPLGTRPLIIEGAGGIHVPLNLQTNFVDLLQVWDIPVIIVSRHYLGSINHTVLTCEVLQQRGIPIAGIVFNGPSTPSSEEAISQYTGLPILGHVPEVDQLDRSFIRSHAALWKAQLLERLQERHPLNPEVTLRTRLI